jgi:hypothetical protein
VKNIETCANSGLLKAKNIVNDEKNPVFKPIVWHVEAYDKLGSERRVRAQPSTTFGSKIVQVRSEAYRLPQYLQAYQ